VRVVNAPGKVTTSPRLVEIDTRRQKALPDVSIILKTEMADEARAAALVGVDDAGEPDGWTLSREAGRKGNQRGMGECAILTKDSAREVIYEERIRLTLGSGKGRLSVPNYANLVITKAPSGRVTLASGAHLEAHIEGIWARIPLPDRVKVKVLLRRKNVNPGIRSWIESVQRWRARVMELAAQHHVDDIIIAPDGNVDAHKAWVQEMISRAWPGLNLAVTKGNDLGRRAVGWVLTTMDHTGGHVYNQASSDHDAGLYVLKHLNPGKDVPPPKDPPPPFSMCTYNGVRMDHYLKTAVQVLERGRLADLAPLTIFQGDWHTGVAASAGTHDKSGVVDFAPFAFGRKVAAWRDTFGPGWHRPTLPGVWGEHIHCVIESCPELASLAATQVIQYHQGLDGLADHARDPNQHHPRVTWDYVTAWHELNG
jgi:hypothetical protein